MHRRGFTIVELLIVIVVIAILAAITIVAYNGISNRAKASAAQSAAAQATKKVLTYAVENADQYPADLATIGVVNSGDTSYQYSVNNSVSPRTYCITATTSNVSYFESSTSGSPAAGGCPGHSANGVATITNLVTNPSLETNSTLWGNVVGTGGAATPSRQTNGSFSGSAYFRQTYTVAPTACGCYLQFGFIPATAGQVYAASAYGRINYAGNLRLTVNYRNSTGTSLGSFSSSSVAAPTSQWTRLTLSSTAPANTADVRILVEIVGLPPSTATLDADAAMFTTGSTIPAYADGDSSNWAWDGTSHGSTSTGIPL